MKCPKHPSTELLPGKPECFLCQDARESYSVESDRNKFEREQLAQHVQPGVQGIRTRGQYQKLLKRHGLTDDIPTKALIQATRDTSKRERVREERIKSYLSQMAPKFQEKAARLFRP